MTRSHHVTLTGLRKEFFDLVEAVTQSSAVMLADARDQDQERFAASLQAINQSAQQLRDMGREYFDLEGKETPAATEHRKKLRHDMLNDLNVIIGYTAEWIEDCEEEFLQGFLEDLNGLHQNGKQCYGVLMQIRSLDLGEEEPEGPEGADTEPTAEDVVKLLNDPLYAITISHEDEGTNEPGYCLVVDDNAYSRDILTRLLMKQGHRVATAVNGREGLEKLRADSFDIVLLDIMMPEMNGFEVLRHMRADEQLRKLPVLVISGLSDIDFVARCIGMGAEDYLPRPFNPLLLKARLGACLEKKRFRDREALYLAEIEKERRRSDELLHVILPGPIVSELKTTNQVRPRSCDNVAVLFADLVGFTSFCDKHSPEEVVSHLQTLVVAWENIALKYRVEKIKTIGDAFMAAAGLLNEHDNPVLSCVHCGLEMIEATRALPGVSWDLRVGIHVGQVVAGVIGQRQYLFDLWGDTVNTAARMESNGLPGRITLTTEAWQRIAPLAQGDADLVAAKGKGKMAVYRFRDFI